MNSIFIYLLEASICLALSFVFYRLLLANLTFFHWNRFSLLFLVVTSVILPLLSIPVTPWNTTHTINNFLHPDFSSAQISSMPVIDAAQPWTMQDYLLICYIIAVLILLMRLILQLLAVFRIARHSHVQIKDGFLLVDSSGKLSTSSFFHYIFLSKQTLTEQELQQVIRHELVHVRQKHTLDLLFFRLLCVVFWFNPFAYLLARSVEEVHEYLADEGAIQNRSPIQYAKLMLKLATEKYSSATVHHFHQIQLKKRILMLNKLKSTPMKKFRFMLAIPLLGMMSLLFSFDQTLNQQQVKNKLIGSWKGTDFQFEQINGPKISQAITEGGRSLHVGGTFVLNEDETYEIKDPVGTTNGQGTWHLRNDDVLVTKDAGGETVQYQIQKLDDQGLVTIQTVETELPGNNVASKGRIMLTYIKK